LWFRNEAAFFGNTQVSSFVLFAIFVVKKRINHEAHEEHEEKREEDGG